MITSCASETVKPTAAASRFHCPASLELLQKKINALPEEHISELVTILGGESATTELEVDLTSLSEQKLKALYSFVRKLELKKVANKCDSDSGTSSARTSPVSEPGEIIRTLSDSSDSDDDE
jgi:hypothetical protein